MADTFSVLTGKRINRLSEVDVQKALDEAQAKARAEIAAEVNLRVAAEARATAAEAACTKACEERDRAIAERDAAKAIPDDIRQQVAQLTARLDSLRKQIENTPAPVMPEIKFPESPKYDDTTVRQDLAKIQQALSGLGKKAPVQVTNPPRKIAGFDLQVTARDATGAILSLRAVPST